MRVSQSLLSRQNAAEVFNWFLQAWAFSPCTRLPVSVRVHFKVFVIEVLHDWLLSDLLIPYIIPRAQWKLKGDLFSVCGTNCPPPHHIRSAPSAESCKDQFKAHRFWYDMNMRCFSWSKREEQIYLFIIFKKVFFIVFIYIIYPIILFLFLFLRPLSKTTKTYTDLKQQCTRWTRFLS